MLFCQLVEIFDERHHRAVEALDFRVRGFDDVIFVRRMRAAAVAESEMSGRQLERFAGEDVTGIRTGVARPEQRVDSELFVGCQLRLDQCRIFRCGRRIVPAGHVHFDVAEAALRQMGLQRGKRVRRFHVGHESHVDFRDGAMRQNRFAAGAGVAADRVLRCLLSAAIPAVRSPVPTADR